MGKWGRDRKRKTRGESELVGVHVCEREGKKEIVILR